MWQGLLHVRAQMAVISGEHQDVAVCVKLSIGKGIS